MPGIAALVNKSVPKDKSIQLFYNTDELNLGLVLKSGDDSDDPDKSYVAQDSDHKGIVVNPSQIGAAEFLGINVVVGITQRAPGPEGSQPATKYNVSIISPVYRPLTSTEKTNTSIAICATAKAAYVYYLGMKLQEYRMDTFGTSVCDGTTGILKGSSLAAYCIGNERFVIYQSSTSNDLREYGVGKNDTDIDNSNGAVKGTTVAVAYFNQKVYLYYTDNLYRLRKIVKEGNVWGPSYKISGSEEVDASSQLAVTTANGVNNVFYIPKGETTGNFSHVRDPIV